METITLTPEEMAEYMAYKQEKERREAEELKRQNREVYRQLVDSLIEQHFPVVQEVSSNLARLKAEIMETFQTAVRMKQELYEVRDNQATHTFTNTAGNKRIMIGVYTTDSYRDTVNEGIAMVKEAIINMAKDDDTRALVEAILKLLSKDQKGNLKASRVLQLRQLAERLGNERILEGVKVIEDSYQPQVTKTFVRAEYKNDRGEWVNVPLGMTEA